MAVVRQSIKWGGGDGTKLLISGRWEPERERESERMEGRGQ
jgi:hypothetical protein